MPLLALALIAAWPQQAPSDPKPTHRRTMALINRSEDPLPAGAQIQVTSIMMFRIADGSDASDVQVFHRGKRIASWSKGSDVWFRNAESIPGRGRDGAYELRYGGGPAVSRPDVVFEFFDGFAGTLDPKKWDWSADLGVRETAPGLEVVRIPAGTGEFAPVSLTPRVSLPSGFVFEAEIRWAISEASPASFALRADLAPESKPDEATLAKGAALVKRLEADDIGTRDEAVRELLKLGAGAVPALQEAAKAKDLEFRQRAAQVLSRILEDAAPPAIRTGLSPGDTPGAKLDRIDLLGRSRTVLKRSHDRNGGDTLAISRAEDGQTTFSWTRRRPVTVHGKVERVRIDFWSPSGTSDVLIRLSRVSVRRHVDLMPAAEVGAEEAMR
jgi:hypothetical protein